MLSTKIINALNCVNYDHNKGIENTSPWKHILNMMDKFDPESYDRKELLNVANMFATRLLKDQAILEGNASEGDQHNESKEVTECALLCPTWGSHYDKLFGICSLIAPIVFPKEDPKTSDSDHEIEITGLYTKLLASLRKMYKAQLTRRKDIDEAFRVIIDSNKRQKFNELKKLPISDHILYPVATVTDCSEDDPAENASIDPLVNYLLTHAVFTEISEHSDTLPDSPSESQGDVKGSDTDSKRMVVFDKGTIYSDGRLDLCFQCLTVPELRKLLDALSAHLQNQGFIEHVLLGNNNIGNEGAKMLAEFMTSDSRIRTWYICACNIDAYGIKFIADALKESKRVESLWLKRNPLMTLGIKHIADMLQVNKSIRVVDLCNTAMLDEGCEYLFDKLHSNKTVESLYIGSCGITHIGTKNVADYFDKMKQNFKKNGEIRIQNLYIDVNRLDDHGAEILCKALHGYPLERLSMGSNRLSDTGIKIILDTFVDSTTLIFLDIGSCKATVKVQELPNNLGDKGVKHIVDFLKQNKSVRIFNVRHVGITSTGLGTMYKLLIDESTGSLALNTVINKFFVDQAGVKINSVHSGEISEFIKTVTSKNIITMYNMPEKDFNHQCAGWICHGPLIKYVGSQYISSNAQ